MSFSKKIIIFIKNLQMNLIIKFIEFIKILKNLTQNFLLILI